MAKIWELIPKDTKTKVMAYRHYLEKQENNKGGKTMRIDGRKLVVEGKDLNVVLAEAIRDHQFHNRNEMPDSVVIEVPATVSGKDRNEIDYAVPLEITHMPITKEELAVVENVPEDEPGSETAFEPEDKTGMADAVGEGLAPASTAGEGLATEPEEGTEAGSENEPALVPVPVPEVDEATARQEAKAVGLRVTQGLEDYYCSECKRMHLAGSKIHKSHKKYAASKA